MYFTADSERKKYWDIFDRLLVANGEPFSINHTMNGETKFFGAVNKYSAMVDNGLTIDFLFREKVVKVQLYMRNDVRLYEKMAVDKEKIEEFMGSQLIWVEEGKVNQNTRRIVAPLIPIEIGNTESYYNAVERALPIVMKFIEVAKIYDKYSFFDF